MPYLQELSVHLLLGRSQAHGVGYLQRRKQVNRLAWLEAGLKRQSFTACAGKNFDTNSGLTHCSPGGFWICNDYDAKLVIPVEI